jgi:tungstate transport system permease protein
MEGSSSAFWIAIELLVGFDAELADIVGRSLAVSLSAVTLASLIGLPLGAFMAVYRYPGRKASIILLNALMGLPPVFVGLIVYIMLSRSGPLGVLGLLYTPWAMIIAQTVLITPIIAALARQIVRALFEEYRDQLCSFGATPSQMLWTLLRDCRAALVTAVMAGFGRALAEVGAVFIVGGNIAYATRVMTTAIALETAKGNLALALALGLILVLIALSVNAIAAYVGGRFQADIRT